MRRVLPEAIQLADRSCSYIQGGQKRVNDRFCSNYFFCL